MNFFRSTGQAYQILLYKTIHNKQKYTKAIDVEISPNPPMRVQYADAASKTTPHIQLYIRSTDSEQGYSGTVLKCTNRTPPRPQKLHKF